MRLAPSPTASVMSLGPEGMAPPLKRSRPARLLTPGRGMPGVVRSRGAIAEEAFSTLRLKRE
jgi:hypothetical protein